VTARIRVLVTDASSTKALAVVRALGSDHEVWTTSGGRGPLAAWSRYASRHVIVPTTPATFAQAVKSLCLRERIDVVIPPEERSSFLLAREQDEMARAGVRVACAPLPALQIAMDKARTVEAARAAGVSVPHTVIPGRLDESLDAAKAIGYPVVVKPRFSHFWADERFISTDGVAYASDATGLEAVLATHDAALPPPLLQEFVPGAGLGIFLLLGEGGTLLAEFAHERIRDIRPTGSGSVVRRSVPVSAPLRDAALRLLRSIGWRGPAMVEFRRDDRDGVAKLMEINGRLWGSLQLATDAGVNFPRLMVRDALGLPALPAPSYRTGVVLRWWLGDLVRLARVFRGPPRGYTGAFPSRARALREFLGPQPDGTRAEVLRWDDPLPALGEVVGALRGRT
jgi:predicted ATP-grasp superfamily ATP-dependent carboligase